MSFVGSRPPILPFVFDQVPSVNYISEAEKQRESSRTVQPILFSQDAKIQIYTAANSPVVSTVPACREDLCTSYPDPVVRQAYNGCKLTYNLFKLMGRDPIDDLGRPIRAVVHYQDIWGVKLSNAKWDRESKMLFFGDGDGINTQSFVSDSDIIGHELTHGIINNICPNLPYVGESGALNEHISDAFGIMVKQYSRGEQATDSDWLIGDNTFIDTEIRKIALRSMKEPGNRNLIDNPQPSHMKDYNNFAHEVHILSGIPNHAFYLAAINIGGYTWEKTGKIWYQAMLNLQSNETFSSFADKTVSAAKSLFPQDINVITAIENAWENVGISVTREVHSTQPSISPPHVTHRIVYLTHQPLRYSLQLNSNSGEMSPVCCTLV